jgi:hypothetical protein
MKEGELGEGEGEGPKGDEREGIVNWVLVKERRPVVGVV